MTTHEDAPDRWKVSRHRGGAKRGVSCPPHGPILVTASEGGRYAASCLACGFKGPERVDGWEAKLAFDEAPQPPPR